MDSAIIRTSTTPTNTNAFHRLEQDGLILWFHRDLQIYDVRIGWTPVTGFDVTWPGTTSAGG
jgi:hypothetical protein